MATPDDNTIKNIPPDTQSPENWFAEFTELYGQRPSFITLEVERDSVKPDDLATVRLYHAMSLIGSAKVVPFTTTRERAQEFTLTLIERGYIRQRATADHVRLHQSYAAPESEVGDSWGAMKLLPRTDMADA